MGRRWPAARSLAEFDLPLVENNEHDIPRGVCMSGATLLRQLTCHTLQKSVLHSAAQKDVFLSLHLSYVFKRTNQT